MITKIRGIPITFRAAIVGAIVGAGVSYMCNSTTTGTVVAAAIVGAAGSILLTKRYCV